MKVIRLIKVEMYRFVRSMSIIKYVIILSVALLFMSYINIAIADIEVTKELTWGSLSANFMYILAIVCVVSAVYIGREFRLKTIYYEVMNGYSFSTIGVAKTVTCGILLPLMMVVSLFGYIVIFSPVLDKECWYRMLLVFVLFAHICSCTTLYVLICRSAMLGGCIAFVKFYAMETCMLALTQGIVSQNTYDLLVECCVAKQWINIINISKPVEAGGIFVVALLEYAILMIVLYVQSKKLDCK